MLTQLLDALHRQDGGRLLARLIHRLRDFDRAEEALQDAYARALVHWPSDGVPDNPAGWIATVALRCGLDRAKHERRSEGDHEALLASLVAPELEDIGPEDDSDERLRLIFTCCHPSLAQSAQVALALRTLGGLSTAQIARVFLESEASAAQKIVRAKRKIARAGIPFVVPSGSALVERLSAVLAVVYFIFNEGYSRTSGSDLLQADLTNEAIRLGRLIMQLMQQQTEVQGLLALMLFHESRRMTRIDAAGTLVSLEEQDRSRWNQAYIAEANQLMDTAMLMRRPGPYQIQAAIAALHAQAANAASTDWLQISALYGALLRYQSTPVVELNAAVALAMASSIDRGLAWIDQLDATGALENYHLLHAARADLLRRAGRSDEAALSYAKAIALTCNDSERRYLESRLAALTG